MTVRVAIAGLGPKGLFALERLVHHARAAGVAPVVDVFEPHEAPGAGPVYDPRQPSYLRMNFASANVDLWPDGSLAVPARDRRSFTDWAGPGVEDYAPRADVGRYLSDGFRLLADGAPGRVRHVARRVARVERAGEGWTVDGLVDPYDEVLLTTGHRPGGPDGVFPVHRLDRVPGGSVVAIRGFALTALDACLALTEGRGGRFEDGGAGRLRYRPSGREPARLLPFSRTGRPMLAKPRPDLFDDRTRAALDDVTRAAADRVRALAPTATVDGDLVPLVARTAAALLEAVGAPPGRALPDPFADTTAGPRAALDRSVAVAAGRAAPDAMWALGHAWRSIYPAVVARVGGAGLPAAQWPAFHRAAAALERVAFGPPLLNARKLLALIDAGVVDVRDTRRRPAGLPVIDAVLPGPGADERDDDLVGRLLVGGHARRPAGRRGIEVRPDGRVVGRDGAPVPGLSALGRPTEDWVVGNDTLDRTLHPGPDLWARRVVARARATDVRAGIAA